MSTYDYDLSSDPRSALYEYLQVLALCSPATDIRKAVVLDVGCGMNWLRDLFGLRAIGVDIATNSRADIIADATMLPLRSKCVDVAISVEVIEHLPPEKQREMIREMARVARKCIAVSTVNALTGPHDSRHVRELTLRDLIELLKGVGTVIDWTCGGSSGLPRVLRRLLPRWVWSEWCGASVKVSDSSS